MRLHCHREITTTVRPSANVMEVAAMFGLGIDEDRRIELIPPTTIEIEPHQLIFITGASGSGKSTLLRLIGEAAKQRPEARVIRFDALGEPPDAPLVDCFGDAPLAEVLHWLSVAGLNDAFVMLRRPAELSDGQRYRFQLARCIADIASRGEIDAPAGGEAPLPVVLADEFAATLDRLTAQVLARNVRKWVNRTPICFVAATTHDDLLEPFEPDVLIEKHLGEGIEIVTRANA